MLTALSIENFTIVKHLELDFKKGMTAFTGETGAGKSIMIDALMLALGERGDINLIRKGEAKCEISATFHIEASSEPQAWLGLHDLANDEGEVILRRVLYAEGRSKLYINGQPFPSQKVKELSEMLVHIHGQHQHQTLLAHPTHRQQLDQFAGHEELLEQVQCAYKRCLHIKNQIARLKALENQHDKSDLLSFQIEELNQLNPEPGEFEALSEEHQLLHHAQDYLTHSQSATQYLEGDEGSITLALSHVKHHLEQLPQSHPAIQNANELINNALIHCEEAVSELRRFHESVHLDPERLVHVEDRLSDLHHAGRKYHVDAKQLPEHWKKLTQELSDLQATDEQLAQLERDLENAQATYQQVAKTLTNSRKQAAQKLGTAITDIIQQLGMPKGHVCVQMTPLDKMQAYGMDKVEYLVCTNPGCAMDSLSKIASGGELSRISLAIQVITAQCGSTPTLLFDEVDVGIGGSTAALVGRHLRQLGERLQVFCVTHQPQVASSAHNHFVVSKQSDDEQTFSTIAALNEEDKVDEIARMLGGLNITEQTRLHAKELLML